MRNAVAVGNAPVLIRDMAFTTPAASWPRQTFHDRDGIHKPYPLRPGENPVFRTTLRTDVAGVSVLGIATTVVSIYNGRATNLAIALFIVAAVGVMLKAAVAAISDALLKNIEDAYDAGKAAAHRADVLDLALKRQEGRG